MNLKKQYITIALIAGITGALSVTAFAQQQNDEKKKEQSKPAAAQQHAAPQAQAVHHVAPKGQTEHHVAPQGQAMHHVASQGEAAHQEEYRAVQQQQVNHVSNQSARDQNSVVRQGAAKVAQSGGNNEHIQRKHARISANQQVANGSAGASHQYSSSGVTPQFSHSGNNQGGGQSVRPQTVPNTQYNSGNNYGGYWSSADAHSDWNHHGQHYWNGNNYAWYQGGWLIVNTAFNPFYVNSGYDNGGSLVSSVQASLANQGYYNGPVDGDAGPGTRNAIERYQSDNNLDVTGHINGALLQSLQIQQ